MNDNNDANAKVITREDREFLTPILGGPYMVDLMMRDREAWKQTGTLITQAFIAGKAAAYHGLKDIPDGGEHHE